MSWRVEWRALSARIKGLSDGAEFYVRSMAFRAADDYNAARHNLLPQARAIHQEVQTFAAQYGDQVPRRARECLERFLATRPEVFTNEGLIAEGAVLFQVTALTALRSEFEHCVADVAAFTVRQSERAFAHLQRTIVADADERQKWQNALAEGEVRCEKLGAARLLSHGIWAFKIDGAGERTDLVFQEPLVADEITRSADALVLTEWKLCADPAELAQKLDEARVQTHLYRGGVLAGLELAAYRYLVVVSERRLAMPADQVDAGITYRHINISVDPEAPARAARDAARRNRRARD